MAVAGAPLTAFHIIFQRGVSSRRICRGLHGLFRQAGTAQIGMQGDAGGIDHRTQGGLGGSLCRRADLCTQIFHGGQRLQVAVQHPAAQIVDMLPHQIGNDALGQIQRRDGRLPQYLVHLGQASQQMFLVHSASLHIYKFNNCEIICKINKYSHFNSISISNYIAKVYKCL